MRSRLMRVVGLGTAVALLSSGCMLSRAVDRAFLGISVRKPQYQERKTTGVFLLPFTFAIDLVTFPIQALLVVILGDGFPYNDATEPASSIVLNENPQFRRLSTEQQALALAELRQLISSGQVTKDTALGLTEDGHWMIAQVSPEVRAQLIARAGQDQSSVAVCAR